VSLRNIVIFLLIANLGYFTYSQGWLSAVLGSDAAQREPERVTKQVNPNAIAVTSAPSLVQATPIADPPVPPSIAPPAQAIAEQAPNCASKREQWVVYMGPYANKTLSDKKKAELSGLGVSSSFISKPTLKTGLSLGQFDSENAARGALAKLSTQGVKTATVVLWAISDCPPN
jgi:cell division protein FtsN